MDNKEVSKKESDIPKVFSPEQELRILELIKQQLAQEHKEAFNWPSKEQK